MKGYRDSEEVSCDLSYDITFRPLWIVSRQGISRSQPSFMVLF